MGASLANNVFFPCCSVFSAMFRSISLHSKTSPLRTTVCRATLWHVCQIRHETLYISFHFCVAIYKIIF
jgi:hypothetical protein